MTTRYSDTILIGQNRVAFQSFCHSILCCCFCFVFVTVQGDAACTSERFSFFILQGSMYVHGVNGCPTCTPCTTGDRIIMWSECEGVVCTRLGKRIRWVRNQWHNIMRILLDLITCTTCTFSSFEAPDKKWTYTTGIINYTVLFKEHPSSSQGSLTTTLSSAE